MITTAIFAGNEEQARQCMAVHDLTPETAKYIRNAEDIHGLRDVEIIMTGTYYEQGQNYTELADQLERQNNGERTDGPREVAGFTERGANEAETAGKSGEDDISDEGKDGQGERDGQSGNDTSRAGKPNLPRRKPDAAEAEDKRVSGLVNNEGGDNVEQTKTDT